METFYLTNKLRKELKKPFGTLITGSRSEVEKKFKKILQTKKFKRVITVGDYCSFALFSNIKILNGRIGRNNDLSLPCQPNTLYYSFCQKYKKFQSQKNFLSCSNPSSSINKTVWKTIKTALKKNKNIFVKGEEDLLVIPCVLLAQPKDLIVYGFPNKGVCLIEVSSVIKKDIKKLLLTFRKGKFAKIALGGTFDPFAYKKTNKTFLHKGHRYFLKITKYYAKKVLIGLCSDKMVKNRKKDWNKIYSFKNRKKNLENYLNEINVLHKIVKINDMYGPVIKQKNLEAILLTEETFENGVKINRKRKEKKLSELHYIILPYCLDKTGKKISSSGIRNTKR